MDSACTQVIQRLDAEDKRINHRVDELAENVKNIQNLTLSVEKLAMNMENMISEQKSQGERLEKLEQAPAENAMMIKNTITTKIIDIIVGALVGGIIMLIMK